MESPVSEASSGSFGALLSSVVQEGQAFVRAETALLKVEARDTLKLAVLYLVLTIVSALLLGGALSLAAAACVLAAHGGVVAALLTAAAVDAIVAATAISVMLLRLRQKTSSPPIANATEHTGELS
jgi:hypothetical protein